jgi:hypothetical protein
MYIDITGLSEVHPDILPGVLSCKNFHRYNTSDMFPLRESTFEGVPAMVPYNYDTIIIEEYGKKALIDTEFEGYASLHGRPTVGSRANMLADIPGIRWNRNG